MILSGQKAKAFWGGGDGLKKNSKAKDVLSSGRGIFSITGRFLENCVFFIFFSVTRRSRSDECDLLTDSLSDRSY